MPRRSQGPAPLKSDATKAISTAPRGVLLYVCTCTLHRYTTQLRNSHGRRGSHLIPICDCCAFCRQASVVGSPTSQGCWHSIRNCSKIMLRWIVHAQSITSPASQASPRCPCRCQNETFACLSTITGKAGKRRSASKAHGFYSLSVTASTVSPPIVVIARAVPRRLAHTRRSHHA